MKTNHLSSLLRREVREQEFVSFHGSREQIVAFGGPWNLSPLDGERAGLRGIPEIYLSKQ